jgi:hypothetical protein
MLTVPLRQVERDGVVVSRVHAEVPPPSRLSGDLGLVSASPCAVSGRGSRPTCRMSTDPAVRTNRCRFAEGMDPAFADWRRRLLTDTSAISAARRRRQ